jgi:hypothetical protein
MRRFHSYGPVDEDLHFCVPRTELVQSCVDQLVGAPEKGGHYFTLWAPRQAGKTWLMRQAKAEIERKWGDRFAVATMSVQGVIMRDDDPPEAFLEKVPRLLWESRQLRLPEAPPNWEALTGLFLRDGGVLDRPLILFIDEFDSLPRGVIDQLVTLFRDMHLKRESYLLHGLALIGVRAVLGVESRRGSPFNIQRSLHVPNLTEAEVAELFRQYREESGQEVAPEVVEAVYRQTRGQPGLVGWFGELLTEKYNPGPGHALDAGAWRETYAAACQIEWNNTVLNLLKKAQGEYCDRVIELFSADDVPFRLDEEWCNYLYLNGVIDSEHTVGARGEPQFVCRFSCPFVQERLFSGLSTDLVGDRMPILPLEIFDDLDDVFGPEGLDLAALLERYKAYLVRLAAKGIDPWREQPRRADLHLTEAVAHFHLYAWLVSAVGRRCAVSPEFPTGNGKVDLHLWCDAHRGVIEVKSFVDMHELGRWREQAARYGASLDLHRVTLALFAPTTDEEVLRKLSGETTLDGVAVAVVAIGWGTG